MGTYLRSPDAYLGFVFGLLVVSAGVSMGASMRVLGARLEVRSEIPIERGRAPAMLHDDRLIEDPAPVPPIP